MIYRFGRFELDEEQGELRQDGDAVRIQPKPLELLSLLLAERDRIVPADELMERLWSDATVTSASLARAVSHARRAIGDSGQGALIRSFSKRGYRFCGDVIAVLADAYTPEVATREARPAIRGSGEPFVGRGDALARLRTAWGSARAGHGNLVLVSGPAGVGKTRLSEVFVEEASAQGGLALIGNCRDGDGVPPLWLWAQVLRQLLESEVVSDAAAALGSHGAELSALLPDLIPARHASEGERRDQEQDRFLLFDSVTRLLVRSSSERPLILVLEDLQWAGSPALKLLEHLAFELPGSKMLVAGTVREGARERTHPLNRTLELVRRRPDADHIELGGFSRGQVATLLDHAIGQSAPTELTSQLFARTEGIPLFVREAIRLLGERGALAQPERASASGLMLPLHSLDLIRRSLASLSEEAAALVGAAGVIGREFTLRFAAAVGDCEAENAVEWLDEATRCGVIESDPMRAGYYRFRHALFQEATLESLSPGQRARLHHRAASYLEARHADDLDAVISELASHALQGIALGDPGQAYEYARRAAHQAERVHAYEQAAQHYEQALAALEHAERDDHGKRLETWIALGGVLRLTGDRVRRLDVLRRAMASARELGRPKDFARAAIRFCDVAEWTPRDDEGRKLLGEALAGLSDADLIERTRLTARLSFFALPRSLARGEEIAREALALARKADDPLTLHEALYALHYCVAGPDHLDEREAMARELAEGEGNTATREPAVISLIDVASDRLTRGDVAGAAEFRTRAGRVAGENPFTALLWNLRVYDTGLAQMKGDYALAERLLGEQASLGDRLAHPYRAIFYGGHRIRACFDQGHFEQADEVLQRASTSRAGPDAWVIAALARTALRLGRRDEAERLFGDLAKQGFAEVPRNIRWLNSIFEIALLCSELDDAKHAPELEALLTPYAHFHGVFPMVVCYAGPVTRCLALLSRTMGLIDDALELFEDALEATAAMGARPIEAVVAAEYANALGSRRAAKSRALYGRALAIADELGLVDVAERSRRALSA